MEAEQGGSGFHAHLLLNVLLRFRLEGLFDKRDDQQLQVVEYQAAEAAHGQLVEPHPCKQQHRSAAQRNQHHATELVKIELKLMSRFAQDSARVCFVSVPRSRAAKSLCFHSHGGVDSNGAR